MSWRTSRLVLGLRSLGRITGLNRAIISLLGSGGYEDRFQAMLLDSIQPGDCVWDVGANVGLYTTKFSELVGMNGRVIAFEPSPVNFTVLQQEIKDRSNIKVVPAALGKHEDKVAFQQGDDPVGATSKLLDGNTEPGDGLIQVEVRRGDELVAEGAAHSPNVIKIDTEGFELDVLEGLGEILNEASLRTLCIEVHFRLLAERGLGDAPSRIEAKLEESGFRYEWPDASHIVANRISP